MTTPSLRPLDPGPDQAEVERQRLLAEAVDARCAFDPAMTERRRQGTLRGLADVDAGRLIDDEAMRAWAESLGTEHELPPPDSD